MTFPAAEYFVGVLFLIVREAVIERLESIGDLADTVSFGLLELLEAISRSSTCALALAIIMALLPLRLHRGIVIAHRLSDRGP